MKAQIILGLCLGLSGCAVFEAIFEGLGALVDENADRPRFAYTLDTLTDATVRIATITEDDLGLPLRTVDLGYSEADVTCPKFNADQSLLSVCFIEYFPDGLDQGFAVINVSSGTQIALQTDNTVGSQLKSACGDLYQAEAQGLVDQFWVDFEIDGPVATAFWKIEDIAENGAIPKFWLDQNTLAVGYSLSVLMGYETGGEFDDILQTSTKTGTVSYSPNASGTWVIEDCVIDETEVVAPETRELRAGSPTGIDLDGAHLVLVLGDGVAFEKSKVASISRWTY